MVLTQALSSDGFVESIMTQWGGSANNNPANTTSIANIAGILLDCGIRYLRTSPFVGQINGLTKSGGSNGNTGMIHGVRFLCGFGTSNGFNPSLSDSGVSTFVSQLNSLVAAYPGSLACIEGLNEPDDSNWGNAPLGGGQTGINQTIASQKSLWAACNASSALSGIPVAAPPLGDAAETSVLVSNGLTGGNYYNHVNTHNYAGSYQPETGGTQSVYANTAYMYATAVAPLQNSSNTIGNWGGEGGYSSSPSGQNAGGVDIRIGSSAEAIYMPRLHLFYWIQGSTKNNKYDLVEDGYFNYVNNPGNGIPNVASASFTPAYYSVKNTIQLCADPLPSTSSPVWTPLSMNYTITGGTNGGLNSGIFGPTGTAGNTSSGTAANVYHTLLSKQDGSFIMVLWLYKTEQNTAVWNEGNLYNSSGPYTGGNLSPSPTQNITITVPLATAVQTAALPNPPATSNAGLVGWTNGTLTANAITVPVGDTLTFVHFTLAAASLPGQVVITNNGTTATTQALNWTTATGIPTDYIVTVTELT